MGRGEDRNQTGDIAQRSIPVTIIIANHNLPYK